MKKAGMAVFKAGMEVYGIMAPCALYVLSLNAQQVIYNKLNMPCRHSCRVGLLCLEIAGIEHLAISCSDCKDIKLLNLFTTDLTTSYSGKKMFRMCEGEGNTLYVEASHNRVLELDCTQPVFSRTNTLTTNMSGHFKGMCYVPSPHKLLVASNGGKVVAISCDTNKVAWERNKLCFNSNPRGLYYSQTHHAILVADGFHSRILLLNPATGRKIQTIQLPGMEEIIHVCLNSGQLVVRHNTMFGRQISIFSVN